MAWSLGSIRFLTTSREAQAKEERRKGTGLAKLVPRTTLRATCDDSAIMSLFRAATGKIHHILFEKSPRPNAVSPGIIRLEGGNSSHHQAIRYILTGRHFPAGRYETTQDKGGRTRILSRQSNDLAQASKPLHIRAVPWLCVTRRFESRNDSAMRGCGVKCCRATDRLFLGSFPKIVALPVLMKGL